jgi:preprotein translocase subunit SecD
MTVRKALCRRARPLAALSGGLALLIVPGMCLLALGGCGDGAAPTPVSDTGKIPTGIYLEFVVDGTLSNAEVAETMTELEDVIRKRAEGFGAEVTAVERREPDQLAFELSVMTLDEADELFARTALLDFREPLRDESGNIVCEGSAGRIFTVLGDTTPDAAGDPRATYIVPDTKGNMTQCQGPADATPTGSVVWTLARGVGTDGVEKDLTGRFLEPSSEVIFDALGRPLVRFEFDSEGTSLFDQVTARLVGLPIAICLDGEIISAPSVRSRLSRGIVVITGLTEDEARRLAVQLNSGPLPESAHIRAVGQRSRP